MIKLKFSKPPFNKTHADILIEHNNNQRVLPSAKFLLHILDITEDHPEFKSYVKKIEKAKPVYFDWIEIELETIKTNLTLEKNEQPIEVLKPKFDIEEIAFFKAFGLNFLKFAGKDFEEKLKAKEGNKNYEKLKFGSNLLKAFHLWLSLIHI